ncbi:MAG: hypothetical protein LBC02_11165 [Planctomycetaceae bacterium]|jgi:mono/diheme cytochrome c family protein|nr:hypothetical protein [Planctomycetaceae bacterium]
MRSLFFFITFFIVLSPLRADETVTAREILLKRGIEKIVFVKRFTYTASNYYTEYVNSAFLPGGNICVLDLKSGLVTDLCSDLQNGVFERFDLNFNATKIVFAWKKSLHEGYRLYEVRIDGTELRQVLSPPENEERLVKLYKNWYHHGTDDLSPCWLPDGDICFVSSRCQYGITCDAPDTLTATVLYRCSPDGTNLKKLSGSAVSESSPVCLSDGRILYTRWEYVDKGSVSVKCLWSMRPDGTATSEVFGNNIALPPTFIYGREIPDSTGWFVFTGAPHSPYTAMGPVFRVDTNGDIRTKIRMESMTPQVRITEEVGWEFFDTKTNSWYIDREGHGALFKEAFPLNKDLFIVSHKPKGTEVVDPKGYGLYLLDSKGNVLPIYRDTQISCWNPIPVLTRPVPPVLPSQIDPDLSQRKLARMFVADVYHGLDNIPRGTVKYLRILEQVPRPWSARRWDFEDEYGQQHAAITKGTHLVLKVLHGVVPVEEDGSASYYVPAEANIFVQALDKNYAAVQTERTYLYSMSGETRSCIGCHERRNEIQHSAPKRQPKALLREPDFPQPQPGDDSPRRVIDYVQDIQPIWNKYCIECHGETNPKGNLRLDGNLTRLFNVSYEQLVPDRYEPQQWIDHDLVGVTIGEHHPKTGNVEYLQPKSLGSHSSVLAAMLSDGKIILSDSEKQKRVKNWKKDHADIHLTLEEQIRFQTWIDTNCQYYGSYYGRRNIKYEGRRDFRPKPVFSGKTW